MKPFDLEHALAGDPVVTRDGQDVKIGAFNSDATPTLALVGWLKNGMLYGWAKNGRYEDQGPDSPLDLFMAPKNLTLTAWINWYPSGYCSGYPTKDIAEQCSLPNRIACTEHTIEVDEDETQKSQ